MLKLRAIAINTFREAVRDKILYSLLAFAVLMILFSVVLGELALGEYSKIVKDFGLASISIFGTLIAVFVGIGLVYKEIEQRTIYTILSKPIHRWQFILGKYAGLALTLAVEVSIMTVALMGLLLVLTGEFQANLLIAIAFIYLELLLMTAFAVFFSSFSTPTLSAIFTGSIFVIGHLSQDIYTFGSQAEGVWVQRASRALYLLLPNLENFNFKAQMVHSVAIPPEQLLFALAYGILYTSLVLGGAMIVFTRQDFK